MWKQREQAAILHAFSAMTMLIAHGHLLDRAHSVALDSVLRPAIVSKPARGLRKIPAYLTIPKPFKRKYSSEGDVLIPFGDASISYRNSGMRK